MVIQKVFMALQTGVWSEKVKSSSKASWSVTKSRLVCKVVQSINKGLNGKLIALDMCNIKF